MPRDRSTSPPAGSRLSLRDYAWLSLALLVVSCVAPEAVDGAPDDDDDEEPVLEAAPGFDYGDEITCEQPLGGFDRLTEESELRGFGHAWAPDEDPIGSCPQVPGSIAAPDLDGDGDLDLVLVRRNGFPHLYINDGRGHFDHLLLDVQTGGRSILVSGAVDLDGDSLPEVISVGSGTVLVAPNLGDLEFGPYEVIYEQTDYPQACIGTFNWGDLDGDGDLDLVVPRLETVDSPDPDEWYVQGQPPGTSFDLLLINDGGSFERVLELSPAGDPGLSVTGFFTDRDGDGDLDIYISSDRAALGGIPPTAFFRNDGLDPDGLPILVNDAPAIGADVTFDAMGMGTADLNGDGQLDYCVSDIGLWIPCLLSDGMGGYFEGGLAMNLVPDLQDVEAPAGPETGWASWGLALEDFDADSRMDLAVVAGPPPVIGELGPDDVAFFQPDAIWQGVDDGLFAEQTYNMGFEDPAHHHGLVAADFDADGFLDVAIGPREGPPLYWANSCGTDAWLLVDLLGAGDNAEGFGARVLVEAGGRSWLDEVHNMHSVSGEPSELHFGLGGLDVVDRLEVRWIDGAVSVAERVPVRRRITVTHPSLVE